MWQKFVISLCSITVFVTTYALILPAITQNAQTYCGVPAHEHTDDCYSDPQADVETEETWARTVDSVELTGNWAEDVVAVARTQLTYQESEKNYTVASDDTIKGYTRYGAWYGDPYGDWDTMFTSFCLSYAGVDEKLIPMERDVRNEIAKLEAGGRWHKVSGDTYAPKAGDLIFFDRDQDGTADHTGLITEVLDQAGTAVTDPGAAVSLRVIEGDVENQVKELVHALSDETIAGYGDLSKDPQAAQSAQPEKTEKTEETDKAAAEPVESKTAEALVQTVSLGGR